MSKDYTKNYINFLYKNHKKSKSVSTNIFISIISIIDILHIVNIPSSIIHEPLKSIVL